MVDLGKGTDALFFQRVRRQRIAPWDESPRQRSAKQTALLWRLSTRKLLRGSSGWTALLDSVQHFLREEDHRGTRRTFYDVTNAGIERLDLLQAREGHHLLRRPSTN